MNKLATIALTGYIALFGGCAGTHSSINCTPITDKGLEISKDEDMQKGFEKFLKYQKEYGPIQSKKQLNQETSEFLERYVRTSRKNNNYMRDVMNEKKDMITQDKESLNFMLNESEELNKKLERILQN